MEQGSKIEKKTAFGLVGDVVVQRNVVVQRGCRSKGCRRPKGMGTGKLFKGKGCRRCRSRDVVQRERDAVVVVVVQVATLSGVRIG